MCAAERKSIWNIYCVYIHIEIFWHWVCGFTSIYRHTLTPSVYVCLYMYRETNICIDIYPSALFIVLRMSEAGRVLFSSPFPTPHKLEGQKVGRYLRIMAAEGKGSRQLASSAPICFPERGEEISEDAMPEWLTLQKNRSSKVKFLRMPSISMGLELTIFFSPLGKLPLKHEFMNTSSEKIF